MNLDKVGGLDAGELALLRKIGARVSAHQADNLQLQAWYDAKVKVPNLGLALPERTGSRVRTVAGWPGMVVDALEERLDIDGFDGPTREAAGQIWAENYLDSQYSEAHIEALVHGVAFIVTDKGGPGDPQVVITVESPLATSGIWDPVRRRLSAAATFITDPENPARVLAATLYLPNETIQLDGDGTGALQARDSIAHNLGRPTVECLVNRPRTSKPWGRSEITEPIISYTQAAIRTLLRAEIGSEFFSAPQRYVLNMSEDMFGPDRSMAEQALKMYAGHMMMFSAGDPDDPVPQLGQFAASSPAPFIEMVKMYAQMVAGEAALPPTYLGFVTDNPASADQIRATEARHVKRAERRQRTFGRAWQAALTTAVALGGGTFPDNRLAVRWKDASTPTKAATTDAVVKQVQAGILPTNSPVTFHELGFDEAATNQLLQAQAQISRQQVMLATLAGGQLNGPGAGVDRGPGGE